MPLTLNWLEIAGIPLAVSAICALTGAYVLGSRSRFAPPRQRVLVGRRVDRRFGSAAARAPVAVMVLRRAPGSPRGCHRLWRHPGHAATALCGSREINPQVTLFRAGTLGEEFDQTLASSRFRAVLLAGFALIALPLASIGIYGVTAHSVSQRTHEVGIRMALGARAGDVIWMMIGQHLRPALVGLAVGIVAALALRRNAEDPRVWDPGDGSTDVRADDGHARRRRRRRMLDPGAPLYPRRSGRCIEKRVGRRRSIQNGDAAPPAAVVIINRCWPTSSGPVPTRSTGGWHGLAIREATSG